MKHLNYLLLLLALVFTSCSKKTSADGGAKTPPTNLNVQAAVSTDNSGNVTFTATATNAASYGYDFGDGNYQTSATGAATYKYSAPGTYKVTVTATSSDGSTASKAMEVTVNVVLKLAWADEFNTDGAPDPARWGYDLGGGGWGNSELEYYTSRPDNVTISGGTLKITAKKEDYSGSTYTSARLVSKDKYNLKYGKVEIRAKLPSGVGTWPALWMLGSNYATAPWPACGEIDIMEHVGKDQNKIYSTLHYPGHSGANGNGSTTVIPTASTEFHRYGVEWSSAVIRFSVDDVPFFTFANSSSTPFNANFFFILNLAMGGNFAGPVDPAITSATMEVDYIRVYQ